MEHKLIILGILLALLSSSCKAPAAYLPEVEEIGVNEFGSYITVDLSEGSDIEGELIVIDSKNLIVLTKEKEIQKLRTISIADISSFKLTYAQPKNYGLTIPGSALVSLSHGALAVFTAPLNIAVTSIITAHGANAFTYNNKSITLDDLKMFARFPQGLPPHIEMANIE
ncbi:hypothetical protein ACKGJN_06165 [Gillisia sp. Q332]|uniref:hypothetical protein n=1 Tax=Gillisia xinjiangensis TaxID=3384765 RepID=UPI00391ABBC0